ncbi:anti-sigma factor [Gordonia crocea]|uniref:Regulator of SigK n=1 Tax=Gordonia crocea TaxID=589162 RepID=A0A7I9UWI5_9ACTN|nr:anti-sigma factor [Gordonia crocea]GED97302.1 hypothetical protein nbrc107697_13410 [Gordonia crocea]
MTDEKDHEFDGVPELAALSALPADERAAFDAHLRTCALCRAELDDLQSTAAVLAPADAPLPPGLRDRVLAAVDDLAHTQEAARVVRLRRRSMAWLAAACALVAMVGSLVVWRSGQPGESPRTPQIAQSAVVSSVMAAPDMTKATASMSSGDVAAMYAPSQRATVVATAGLPPIAPDMMYQVWITVGDRVKSAGMVPGGRADKSMVVMTDMDRPTAVGLSVEPAAGSVQPTSPMVVRFPVH